MSAPNISTQRPSSRIPRNRGSMIMMTLIFGAFFMMLMTSLLSFVLTQKRVQVAKENQEMALQIAEAGLDYYKWFLAHYPNDLTDGTGEAGPYVHDYEDPEGGAIGQFSLDIGGETSCGEVQSVDITSTGWTNEEPIYTREIYGRYARPSVAEYAYILNSNVNAGADREIYGPYHSNGGIVMDGTNYSTVTSAQEEWLCTFSAHCSPSQNVDGVIGDGTGNALWQFPVPNIDFAGITTDLASIKALAQSDGLYFPQVSGSAPRRGYRIVLNPDRTIDVWEVEDSEKIWSQVAGETEFHQRYEIIEDEDFVGTFEVPEDCAVIFVEDRIWLEGQVNGKLTIASADKTNPNYNTDVLLSGDITYTAYDGSDGLTVIAENSIQVPLLSPDDMALNGIFIAQDGNFGRNHYTTAGSKDVPDEYNSYVTRNTLIMRGTVVSNGRVGTKWTCGGSYCSGYNERVNSYDSNLATSPPPLTPYVSDDYEFIQWREEN